MLLHIRNKFINIFKHLNVLNLILVYKCNILSIKNCISKTVQVLIINYMKTCKFTKDDLNPVVQG